MTLNRIVAAEMLPGLCLRLQFADGFAGIAALADTVRIGGVLGAIGDHPESFRIVEGGRAVVWTDADGDEIDLCADALRLLAEGAAVRAAE